MLGTNLDLPGSFTYEHAVGTRPDAVFFLASSTKLLTSIAALQCVERGLFGLDQDVASQLPELAEQPILKGFDAEDKPILQKRKNAITLRRELLSTLLVREVSLLTCG